MARGVSLLYSCLAKYSVTGIFREDGQTGEVPTLGNGDFLE